MPDSVEFPDGGYRFVPGVFPYSGGAAAEAGMEIERARFATDVPVEEGFKRIEQHLASLGRPLTALCAAELRSAEPFTGEGFLEFNKVYVAVLEQWGIFRDGVNPVARTNVCPLYDAPAEPGFVAFSYTVPATQNARRSFIVAGSGELSTGIGNYPDSIIRRGDVSPEGMLEKARCVLAEMERRLAVLGFSWRDVTATNVYTIHDIHPFLATEIAARGAMRSGLIWHLTRPPVLEIEYEMDCRGIYRQIVI